MNKFTINLSIFFILCLTQLLKADTNVEITRGPYLQLQTDTSISIVWCSSTESIGEVLWGKDSSCPNKIISNETTLRHEINLSSLKADTLYFYRVLERDTTQNNIWTFRTAPKDGTEKLSFTIQGDSRSNPSQCKKIFDAMIPQTLNGFCISLGGQEQEFVLNRAQCQVL